MSDNEGYESEQRSDGKRDRRSSAIWSKFTIYNQKECIASCNICGKRMSYKTTSSNLKKHIVRKHSYSLKDNSVKFFKPTPKLQETIKSRNLTELGGLDGLILNVIGEDGEDPTEVLVKEDDDIVEEHISYNGSGEPMHDYCLITEVHSEQEIHTVTEEDVMASEDDAAMLKAKSYQPIKQAQNRPEVRNRVVEVSEKSKRSRIMDLQLECLEIKKYNMQMEALMMENQLNLPRSIFTENLRNADTITRGTQTEVCGKNTKVFYVSDNNSFRDGARQHFFTFQASTNLDD